jgi:hypothetical protein
MKTSIVAAAFVAAVISPLSGCGETSAPPAMTTPATAATPISTMNAPSASDVKTDFGAALLTLADMPTGYTPDAQAGPDYPVMSSCPDEAIALDSYRKDARATTGTAFSTTAGQLVVQSVTLLSGDAQDHTLLALRNALTRCTSWSISGRVYSMSKADYGPYGDETLSYRVTVKGEVPFVLDIVFLRKANLLMGVMVVDQGSQPPKDAHTVVETAVRKLPK